MRIEMQFERKGGLKKLAQQRESLEGAHDVPHRELFADSFMQRFTDFQSFAEFLQVGGFDSADSFIGEKREALVRDRTQFESWEEFHKAAAADWVKRQMGL